ncbi:unnamed protein product, partial [marine sediment metagenome]
RSVLRDLVEVYPGMLIFYPWSRQGLEYKEQQIINPACERYVTLVSQPHSRVVVEAYIRSLEDLRARFEGAFPARFAAEKKTLSDDLAKMRAAFAGKYGCADAGVAGTPLPVASAPSASPVSQPHGKEVLRVSFEDFTEKDWDTGRIFQLPLQIPGDVTSFARPTGDGGNWTVQAFWASDDSRSGKSFQIQLRNPVRIAGGGVEWWLHGKTALAPGKRHTVTIWAKSDFTGEENEYSDLVLGWAPGSLGDSTVQDYTQYSRQTDVAGWVQIALTFISNSNPQEGDRILIAFAARSQKLALNAVFDDLVITQDEP